MVGPTMTSTPPGGRSPGVICVLGDAHLDVIVSLAGPVQPETDTPATTSAGAGGQAANVAAWIVALGGRARLIAAQSADPAGRMVEAELASREVELAGPVLPGRTGVVVSLSDAGRSRSMLTDRGVGTQLQAGHLQDEWFTGCTRLHLPGYSLLREPVQGAAHAAAPVTAVDATGAGDAFAAGYLLGGVSLGLAAAGRAVARMGAMP